MALVIGIAGGSGSGKTTFAENIRRKLEPVSFLPQDAYYLTLDGYTPKQRASWNWDHPDALDLKLFLRHLRQLKKGRGVNMPVYDFVHNRRSCQTITVAPTDIIITEGIHVLSIPAVLKELDVKIYVKAPPDVRLARRMERDVRERGRTFEFSREQYLLYTRPMHYQFIKPSQFLADIIVPEGGFNNGAAEIVATYARIKRLEAAGDEA